MKMLSLKQCCCTLFHSQSKTYMFRKLPIRLYRDTRKGLVIGVYSEPNSKDYKLTPSAQKYNSQTGGMLEDLLHSGRHLTKGKVTVFQNIDSEFYTVAAVGLGSEDAGYNSLEVLDECKENIRIAAASGVNRLHDEGSTIIYIDEMGNAEAAAEGAALAAWKFDDFRNNPDQESVPHFELYNNDNTDDWKRGLYKAEAQNMVRRLSELPANSMTPTVFAQAVIDLLCPCNITVEVRDQIWIQEHDMRTFLAVSKGSHEPPVFIETSYCGGHIDDQPVILVGKGTTYDTGGLNLKDCDEIKESRGDLAGAAMVISIMRAVHSLSLPMNVRGIVPLCENLTSGMSTRPGDIIVSLSGKTIEIVDTNNEGRLLLADTMAHAYNKYNPQLVIDVGTFSSGMKSGLGTAATAVFTKNHTLWKLMEKAGSITGDRVWRFPIWMYYSERITDISCADVSNLGGSKFGSPCCAAAFIKEFVQFGDWIHLDISSSGMENDSFEFPYLAEGRMSGRPTRTIIQFLYQLACGTPEERNVIQK